MQRLPRLLVIVALVGRGSVAACATQAGQETSQAAVKSASAAAADIPFHKFEPEAEEQLLQLANQARRKAGAAELTPDPGLAEAARVHAQAMLAARQLSHQLEGEPSLPQRLAIATSLLLDQEAENVALDIDAQRGHEHLMHSPPHRANLLNAAYNVVGLGVVSVGDHIYIVEDFGHSVPNYSATEVKDEIAATVNYTRRQAVQPELTRRDLLVADAAACSMAQADKLGTAPVKRMAERFTVLTYTTLYPDELPDGTAHTIATRTLKTFSIGACFARTDTYPTGVYWVVLSLE